ncbi:Lrp/AsnC family transcriptional regulator [Mesorhizobium sp. M0859]|uniref:Lrp/AsnC family transcriptional regulator n=1 Tax=Mesorhizobium sp. M0859 TaxID=2957014 RepID=UPI003337DF9E
MPFDNRGLATLGNPKTPLPFHRDGLIAIDIPQTRAIVRVTQYGWQRAMDDLDRRILAALQKNNRLSFAELAEATGSSAASCMRRVNKLRSDGVIVADISLVDPKALGKSLTVVVTVELDRERLDLVDDFKRAMRAAKEVTQCYMVTGDADFVLIVAVKDVEAFDIFVRTKLYTNPNVRKFQSMIALDRVKFEPRVIV